jgi:hypothetical protein
VETVREERSLRMAIRVAWSLPYLYSRTKSKDLSLDVFSRGDESFWALYRVLIRTSGRELPGELWKRAWQCVLRCWCTAMLHYSKGGEDSEECTRPIGSTLVLSLKVNL